jgi:hypothetical protein
MTKLPSEVCLVTFEVRCALEGRRLADAKRVAAKHLRAGAHHSQEFLNVVAEMLETEKGKRGAPKKTCPPRWFDIGNDFLELRAVRADGTRSKYEIVCKELAEKYDCAPSTISATVAFFEKAQRAHDDAVFEFVRERTPNKS